MKDNLTVVILCVFALLLGGAGAYGGYRVGYDRATLEGKLLLSEKDKEVIAAKAEVAAAPRRDGGEGKGKEKPAFEPTVFTAADLAAVEGLSSLDAPAQSKALYILNNVVGACEPCVEQQYSLGKCLQRAPKLLDRTLCQNVAGLAARTVRLAKSGKSPDDIRAQVELPAWSPVNPEGPSRGPKDARITIVEISDFQCPYCKKSQASLHAVDEKYAGKIRWIFINLPLEMHKMARPAALAVMAAEKQGKFWVLADALFASQGLDEAKIAAEAAQVGLNVAKWTADKASTEVDSAVAAQLAVAKKLGITSTPMFFVNGYKVKGAQPPEVFSRIIEAELGSI